MGNINKGTIASISGNTARVVPSDAGAKPTAKITTPVAPPRIHRKPLKRHGGGLCGV